MRGFTFACLALGLTLMVDPGILQGDSGPKADKAKIGRLIKQLGDDEFDKREAASKELKDIGEPAREALEDALTSSGDLEVRQRARRLLRALPPKFLIRTIRVKGLPVHSVALSPDGKHLAASGWVFRRGGDGLALSKEYDIRLFDRATGKEVRRLAVGDRIAGCLSFSPDSKFLATAAADPNDAGPHNTEERSRVFVWNIPSGKVVHELKGHTYAVTGVTFSPDGKRLLTTGWDRTIRLWDLNKGEEIRRLGHGRADWSGAVFLPDGKQAIAGGLTQGGPALVRLDVETGAVLRAFRWGGGRLTTLSLSPDGKRLLTACADGADGRVRLWDVESGKLVRVFPLPREEIVPVVRRPHGSAIQVAFLPRRPALRHGL